MSPRRRAPGPSALIVAHPGHETLLHHWIERTRPCVFVLTDGSGGDAAPRLDHSRRLIASAGGSCGEVFGEAPDQTWYRAVLNGQAGLFQDVIARIAAECLDCGVTTLVSDPVEHFNPIHDLTNVVAHAVAHSTKTRWGEAVSMLTYPIERPEAFDSNPGAALRLGKSAAARKEAAILAYSPLAGEYPRYRELVTRDHEMLAPDDPGFGWPQTLPEEPYYERFGRQRLREGRYSTLITYAAHVRPLALQMLGETRRP